MHGCSPVSAATFEPTETAIEEELGEYERLPGTLGNHRCTRTRTSSLPLPLSRRIERIMHGCSPVSAATFEPTETAIEEELGEYERFPGTQSFLSSLVCPSPVSPLASPTLSLRCNPFLTPMDLITNDCACVCDVLGCCRRPFVWTGPTGAIIDAPELVPPPSLSHSLAGSKG